VKVKSLADLKLVRREIEAQAQREAELKAQAQRSARQASTEKDLFIKAAGAVQPLVDKRRVQLKKEPPKPVPVQQQRDVQAALNESMSDEFDVGTLLDTDELLSFRRPGIGPDVTRKLRQGQWSIQRQLDLHGLRSEEAREALGQFIREAHKASAACAWCTARA
jgi:DNA-nicking Smr family endonuclease